VLLLGPLCRRQHVARQDKKLCKYRSKVARLSSKHAKSKKKLRQLQRHQARQAGFLRTTAGCRSVFGLWCRLLVTRKALRAARGANKSLRRVQLDAASSDLQMSRGQHYFQQQLLKAKGKQLLGMLAASAYR